MVDNRTNRQTSVNFILLNVLFTMLPLLFVNFILEKRVILNYVGCRYVVVSDAENGSSNPSSSSGRVSYIHFHTNVHEKGMNPFLSLQL